MSDCGADDLANTLLGTLTAGETFALPDVDLGSADYQLPDLTELMGEVTKLTNDDLTTGAIDGQGTFDALMRGMAVHLRKEYEGNRITGAEYAKAYTALVQGAMANATQFLLGRDQAYWQAVTAQIQARRAKIEETTSKVQLETAKAQLAALRYEANTAKANFGLMKMKLSTESINYCLEKFNLDEMMPNQKALLLEQILGAQKNNLVTQYNLDTMLPTQNALQLEQIEVQRAQTSNTRTDGTAIGGAVGRQMALHDQQITSYKRDTETKFAKMLSDAWITQKTLDEGTLPPTVFTNAVLDQVFGKLRTNNDLQA